MSNPSKEQKNQPISDSDYQAVFKQIFIQSQDKYAVQVVDRTPCFLKVRPISIVYNKELKCRQVSVQEAKLPIQKEQYVKTLYRLRVDKDEEEEKDQDKKEDKEEKKSTSSLYSLSPNQKYPLYESLVWWSPGRQLMDVSWD